MTIKSASPPPAVRMGSSKYRLPQDICGGEVALPGIVIHFCRLVNIYYETTSEGNLKNTLDDAEFFQLMT